MGLLFRCLTTATAVLLLAAAGPLLRAQDDEKPGKKPPAKDKKKSEEAEDKPAAPVLDEKQQKIVDKMKKDVEAKFKKSKKEVTYLFVLVEKKMEPLPIPDNGPGGAGGPPNAQARGAGPGGGRPKRPGGGGAVGGGGSVGAGPMAEYFTREVKRMDDRQGAIDAVMEWLTKYPPAPKGKKPAAGGDLTPTRTWDYVTSYPKTPAGDKQADAKQEELTRRLEKMAQEQNWKFKKN